MKQTITQYNDNLGRSAQCFEDMNEQGFPEEYGIGLSNAVRMTVAAFAAIIAVSLAAYGLHVANERMAADPVEVLD